MNPSQLQDLLLQTFEDTASLIHVYDAAIPSAQLFELKDEWRRARSRAAFHKDQLYQALCQLQIDPDAWGRGRHMAHSHGAAVVRQLILVRSNMPSQESQVGAAQCVVGCAYRCQLQWQLLGRAAADMLGEDGRTLISIHAAAYRDIRESVLSTQGWISQLWFQRLGLDDESLDSVEFPLAESKC